jgi:quercetin dioxygenase-like cupin family protein
MPSDRALSADQATTRDVVLDARLPEVVPAYRVEVRRIRILAGHAPGLHVHNGPVFGSIVQGSLVFQVEGEPRAILRPGDVFYEPEAARITHFDALDENVTFLAFFLLRTGQEPDIALPEA